MDIYEPIYRRRRGGRRWCLILILYTLVTTAILLRFRDALELLCFFNPFMFLHYSFEYLTYTMAEPHLLDWAVLGMWILSLAPLLGWILLGCGLYAGKPLIQLSEIAVIFFNSVMLIYMGYTSSGINVMLSRPTYFLLVFAGILIPGITLYLLKRWNPKQALKDRKK